MVDVKQIGRIVASLHLDQSVVGACLAAVGPTGTGHRDSRREDLSGARPCGKPVQIVHEVLVHVPVGAQHGQRAAVGSTERTSEAGLPERDSVEYLTSLGHS